MTNAKWLIALDMANVLMGNVFVPEDTQDQPANKVRKDIVIQPYAHRSCINPAQDCSCDLTSFFGNFFVEIILLQMIIKS